MGCLDSELEVAVLGIPQNNFTTDLWFWANINYLIISSANYAVTKACKWSFRHCQYAAQETPKCLSWHLKHTSQWESMYPCFCRRGQPPCIAVSSAMLQIRTGNRERRSSLHYNLFCNTSHIHVCISVYIYNISIYLSIYIYTRILI